MNLNKMRKQNLRDFSDVQIKEFDVLVRDHEIQMWQFWVRNRWIAKYGNKAGIIHITKDNILDPNKIRITMKLGRPNETSIPPL